ncbi:MAG: cryptochrome/photolyase family protein, partial [Saprospiraceae bacterium]
KMGDYCASCQYDRKKKTGSDACPFNSLYWDFYARHADKLRNNPRIGMMYRVWDRFDPAEQAQILARAAEVKATINTL